MKEEEEIRNQMASHIKGGEAFMPLEKFLEEIPFEKLGERPNGLPYSFYELFFHIFFTQRDILEFTAGEVYTLPNWPEAYWPPQRAPKDDGEWEALKVAYFEDREKVAQLVLNLQNGLLNTPKHGKKETLLREVMLVIEHTAYHTGQLMVILRLLGLH